MFYAHVRTVPTANQQWIVKMHENGQEIMDSIVTLVNDIMNLRTEHAAYFESIDMNINGMTSTISLMVEYVMAIHDVSKQVAYQVGYISDNTEKISKDTLSIVTSVQYVIAEIETLLTSLNKLKGTSKIIEESRPIQDSTNDILKVLMDLMSVLTSFTFIFPAGSKYFAREFTPFTSSTYNTADLVALFSRTHSQIIA